MPKAEREKILYTCPSTVAIQRLEAVAGLSALTGRLALGRPGLVHLPGSTPVFICITTVIYHNNIQPSRPVLQTTPDASSTSSSMSVNRDSSVTAEGRAEENGEGPAGQSGEGEDGAEASDSLLSSSVQLLCIIYSLPLL